ncbi:MULTISPECIES: GNAT family N-acetyltransferase [unclassified Enterococcus]|uniref:GNAT family N-acetyltransferase n=1 Tax=unclassified Enterococcus TaxID=2608891 RepID=UPI00155456B1|nr:MULTISPECIES: GNAT family N-acetyltransferase [unclassified Enterococcus]MBS7577116.1 GNAT family N-acetyltransferase [Enterococcus sp. MMGLQ5-2]MBS7584437.1 GNAT family N-acetyltransferase [Enterococcus sp. MMGLQ5-1]NPD12292.1 GNAT family N-acetyltransferase [Enterococcus sp. MMGLQ5-1]NPD36950.1 GNAT family N-acetyltransferase [Enterococcus sp. MMGLQ5-2]
MTVKIIQIRSVDINTLQKITIDTFQETFGDSNTAADLEQYYAENCNQQVLSTEINNPNSFFYFIYYNHELAGYLKLNINDAQTEARGDFTLEIERIYILSKYKRLGLGKKLLKQADKLAIANKKTTIWLGVWEHNVAAQKFYNKLGFVEAGAHYFQLGTDTQRDLILEKISD